MKGIKIKYLIILALAVFDLVVGCTPISIQLVKKQYLKLSMLSSV